MTRFSSSICSRSRQSMSPIVITQIPAYLVLTKERLCCDLWTVQGRREYTTQSNEAFDKEILAPGFLNGASRRERPRKNCKQAWRRIEEIIDMPVNNFILVFGRA